MRAHTGGGGGSLDGHVQWGQRIPSQKPGIYFVSLSADPGLNLGVLEQAPISLDAVEKWLADVPSFTLYGEVQPRARDVVDFFKGSWLPDESIVSIGTATSLCARPGWSPCAAGACIMELSAPRLWNGTVMDHKMVRVVR